MDWVGIEHGPFDVERGVARMTKEFPGYEKGPIRINH